MFLCVHFSLKDVTCQRSADKPVEPVAIPHTEPEDEGTDGGDSRTNTEGHDKYVPRSGHEDYNNSVFENRQFVRETLRITIPPLPIPKGWSRADKGGTGRRERQARVRR